MGCEPTPLELELEQDIALSEPVKAAVPEAIRLSSPWLNEFV